MTSVFSPKDIEEFRTIWREEFGEELSLDRARAEAESLLDLVYQLRTIVQRRSNKALPGNESIQGSGFDLETNAIPHP